MKSNLYHRFLKRLPKGEPLQICHLCIQERENLQLSQDLQAPLRQLFEKLKVNQSLLLLFVKPLRFSLSGAIPLSLYALNAREDLRKPKNSWTFYWKLTIFGIPTWQIMPTTYRL